MLLAHPKPMLGSRVDPAHPLGRGMVARYLFNERVGDRAGDAARGHAGTFTSGPTRAVTPYGPAAAFDGSDDVISVPDAADLNPTTGLTVWCRFYMTNASNWRHLVVKQGTATWVQPYARYALRVNSSNNLETWVNDAAAFPGNYVQGTTNVFTNTWYTAAMTYDNATLKLYLNNALEGTKAVNAALLSSTYPLLIGNNPGVEGFAGQITDVAIWSRALSAAELLAFAANPYQMFKASGGRMARYFVPASAGGGGATTYPAWWLQRGSMLGTGAAA
jgi:hypothetical protein